MFLILFGLALAFVLIYYGLFWVILGAILLAFIIKMARGD